MTGNCAIFACAERWHAGPITLVSLAKADPDTQLDVGALVQKLLPEYVNLLQQLKGLDVPEVLNAELSPHERLQQLLLQHGRG